MEYVGYVDKSVTTQNVVMVSTALSTAPTQRVSFLLINNDPTSNCQLAMIKNSTILFSDKKYYSAMIGSVIRSVSKPLVLMDLRQQYVENIKAFTGNKDALILEQPYKSTNGSAMCIVILKLGVINNYNQYRSSEMQ